MTVDELMARPAITCPVGARLDIPARLMWEFDCGAIIVIGDDGRVAGIVTDRDVAMAALTQGKPLHEIPVTSAMAPTVSVCSPHDSIRYVQHVMRTSQVHRLPVTDPGGRPMGVIALNDLTRRAVRVRKCALDRDVVDTLFAICQPRALARPTRSPVPACMD